MDYLKNTLVLLEEENQQLKQTIKRMQNLENIINLQRGQEQKQYLSRLHQEEINVIRDMHDHKQEQLKKETKRLKREVQELTVSLIQEEDQRISTRRDIHQVQTEKEDAKVENEQLKDQLQESGEKMRREGLQFARRLKDMEGQFHHREQQVMAKYMQRLDEKTEEQDDVLLQKQRIIASHLKRIELVLHEKTMVEEQLQRIMLTLRDEEGKQVKTKQNHQEQIQMMKGENDKLSSKVSHLESKVFQNQKLLSVEKKAKNTLEQELLTVRKRYSQLEMTKKRELQKQKSKTLSMSKNLAEHKKYLKGESETSKRKEREYNQSKKLLIHKIRQMEGKSDLSKINSTFIDRTIAKTSKKNTFETYQSISLDNSFNNKDSPSVSCFIREAQLDSKVQLRSKPLTINTNSHQTLLRFESLDTPCFESAKEASRRTIKVKK